MRQGKIVCQQGWVKIFDITFIAGKMSYHSNPKNRNCIKIWHFHNMTVIVGCSPKEHGRGGGWNRDFKTRLIH